MKVYDLPLGLAISKISKYALMVLRYPFFTAKDVNPDFNARIDPLQSNMDLTFGFFSRWVDRFSFQPTNSLRLVKFQFMSLHTCR